MIQAMFTDFRDETCGMLEVMKRQAGELKEEVQKIRKKWDEWEEFWKGEKEKVWQKMESLENQQKEFDETRKKELKLIEERVSKIEVSVERKRVELTASQDTSEVRVGVRVENVRLPDRLLQIEKQIEGEQRAKKKKNVMDKGLVVNSETGEKEVKKLRS
ncbi:uncharacterized protein LOC117181477 [Belonocnema kinseyi]|uniref:uncharacterized protein LOC117181477 n=1 Tax=Belonocnema kinseyi TaxID=2817044 RepID=UPI00143CCF71|nr:uncharacterized protein LOC117181477 [Belonocnema kinseyi]